MWCAWVFNPANTNCKRFRISRPDHQYTLQVFYIELSEFLLFAIYALF